MPNTYVPIITTTLAVDTASVNFSSLPTIYDDLVFQVSARATTTYNAVDITFNNNTTAVYSYFLLLGSHTTVSGTQDFTLPETSAFYSVVPSTFTSNTFGNLEIYIPRYNASQFKCAGALGAAERNSTVGLLSSTAMLWRNTAAITSIQLASETSFLAGSTFWLYGIKNS